MVRDRHHRRGMDEHVDLGLRIPFAKRPEYRGREDHVAEMVELHDEDTARIGAPAQTPHRVHPRGHGG
jgi:hypothetical protein